RGQRLALRRPLRRLGQRTRPLPSRSARGAPPWLRTCSLHVPPTYIFFSGARLLRARPAAAPAAAGGCMRRGASRRRAGLLLPLLQLCRCSSEDVLILMQVTIEASSAEATTPWRQLPSPRQAFPPLPSMDGVVGKVADSVADVTKQVGEVSGHVE
ncbi:unnamed protein product, partial [Prorocentrum cordatum]